MPTDAESAFARYLQAKVAVDDRSLNRRILERLRVMLAGKRGPRIVEIGTGTGTMAARLADWKLFGSELSYHGIDRGAHGIELARERMAGYSGFSFEQADALSWSPESAVDLVIANAFMDLMNYDVALPHLARFCEPGGLYYFSIVFDGVTVLEPVVDRELDEAVLRSYHADMDARDGGVTGGSMAGRRLLQAIQAQPEYTLIEAGASDWIVHSTDGEYVGDEAFFLSFLLEGIVTTVRNRDEVAKADLDRWASARREQLDSGALILMAHQLDLLSERT